MKIEIVNDPPLKLSDTILRLVRVPAGFGCEELLVGETPVTEAQWIEVMGGKLDKGPDYPVVNISAGEAEEFCRKLSEMSGREFRLPTELEQARCLGVEPENLEDYAVFGRLALTPVKTKLPNEYGLYDVRGGVWEWTSEGEEKGYRYLRGGSWLGNQMRARAVYRNSVRAALRYDFIVGFRLVAGRPPSEE